MVVSRRRMLTEEKSHRRLQLFFHRGPDITSNLQDIFNTESCVRNGEWVWTPRGIRDVKVGDWLFVQTFKVDAQGDIYFDRNIHSTEDAAQMDLSQVRYFQAYHKEVGDRVCFFLDQNNFQGTKTCFDANDGPVDNIPPTFQSVYVGPFLNQVTLLDPETSSRSVLEHSLYDATDINQPYKMIQFDVNCAAPGMTERLCKAHDQCTYEAGACHNPPNLHADGDCGSLDKCYDTTLDTSNPTESTFVTHEQVCKSSDEYGEPFVCADDANTFQLYYAFDNCKSLTDTESQSNCFYNLVRFLEIEEEDASEECYQQVYANHDEAHLWEHLGAGAVGCVAGVGASLAAGAVVSKVAKVAYAESSFVISRTKYLSYRARLFFSSRLRGKLRVTRQRRLQEEEENAAVSFLKMASGPGACIFTGAEATAKLDDYWENQFNECVAKAKGTSIAHFPALQQVVENQASLCGNGQPLLTGNSSNSYESLMYAIEDPSSSGNISMSHGGIVGRYLQQSLANYGTDPIDSELFLEVANDHSELSYSSLSLGWIACKGANNAKQLCHQTSKGRFSSGCSL